MADCDCVVWNLGTVCAFIATDTFSIQVKAARDFYGIGQKLYVQATSV